MKVITGATGHIGNVLVKALHHKGQKLRAFILPGDRARPLSDLDIELVEGNVTDTDCLASAFQGADTVFHLAGLVSIMPGMAGQLQLVNVEGTRNVARACRQAGVKRLVYTSSIHAISEPPHGYIIDENLPFDPGNVMGDYARSKAMASILLQEEASRGGLDVIICCPTGIIGPYDFNVSSFGQLILDFASGHLRSYVEGAYDFVDVRDVATGLIKAADIGLPGRTYIFSGCQVQVLELMKKLSELIGRPAPTYRIPFTIARTAGMLASYYYRLTRRRPVFTAYSIDVLRSNSQISSKRAHDELGFSSRSWQESISDQVEWFRSQNMLPSTGGRRPLR